ncbi:ABC transporter permease, partial [Streptomyces viridosporus]
LSFALQQLQQLLFSLVVLVAVVLAFGSVPGPSWLLVVPALALQFVFNAGLALIFARLGSRTPDLAQLMPFVLRTWMYASGVMFSIPAMLAGRDVPGWLADVLQWNPAAIYMDLVRFALIDGYGAGYLPPHVWAFAAGWALLAGAAGFVYFWKAEERYGRG